MDRTLTVSNIVPDPQSGNTGDTGDTTQHILFIGDRNIPLSQRLIVKFENADGSFFFCNVPVSNLKEI